MIICIDQRTGTGCGAENRGSALHCHACGKPLRFAVVLHDPGDVIGKYRIVRVIGHGGFGAVYEAETHQPHLERLAVKESFDPESIAGFRQEFELLSKLDHPNLPRYRDVFEANDNGYLVMEFVPGQSLQDVLDRQHTALIESQVLGYALQLCDALAYLHRQQPSILHRDIKPANVRLTPEGLIKLVDFGLLKQGGSQTRRTIRGIGTPAYAPLEQYGRSDQRTDVRSDIYSLGATLYHLLSGQEPPAATDRIAADRDVLQPLSECAPHVSKSVAEAVMRALSLTMHQRFLNADEFKVALLGISVAPTLANVSTTTADGVPLPEVAPAQQVNLIANAAMHSAISTKSRLQPFDQLSVHNDYVTDVMWSGDGITLLSCSGDGTIFASRPRSGEAPRLFSAQNSPLWHMIRVPGRKQLAVGGANRRIHLLEEATGLPVKINFESHRGTILRLAVQPDGKLIASASADLSIRIWNTATGSPFQRLDGHLRAVSGISWHPRQHIIASTSEDGTLRIWSVNDGKSLKTLKGMDWFTCVAYAPNGSMLATGGPDGQVRLWSADDISVVSTLVHHEKRVRQVLFSPDGRWLVSVGEDLTAIWDVSGRRLLETLPNAYSAQFRNDGRMLALGRHRVIEVLQVQ